MLTKERAKIVKNILLCLAILSFTASGDNKDTGVRPKSWTGV